MPHAPSQTRVQIQMQFAARPVIVPLTILITMGHVSRVRNSFSFFYIDQICLYWYCFKSRTIFVILKYSFSLL